MLARFASSDVGRYGTTILAPGMAGLAASSYARSLEQKLGANLGFLESTLFTYFSVALAAIGALVVLTWIVALVTQYVVLRPAQAAVRTLTLIRLRYDKLQLAVCTLDDIVPMTEMAKAEFGDLAANAERNRWLLQVDPQSYFKIINDKKKIAGFFCLFRLSKMGKKAMLRGEFDIHECPREYLRADKKYKYIDTYLGSIYGSNKIAKAMALGAVNERLLERRPTTIFARAATDSGLRLLTDPEFRPVVATREGIGEMYMRSSGFAGL